MARKLWDVTLKVGEYESRDGKKRYENVKLGEVWEGDKGPYMFVESTALSMQLFALANKDRKKKIIASMFAPREDDSAGATRDNGAPTSPSAPEGDVPF